MTLIHIHAPKPTDTMTLWCPYCDKVLSEWPRYEWYEDTRCPECNRVFSSDPRHHHWPVGFDIKTGELK